MALFFEVASVAEALAGEGSRLKKRAAVAEAVGRIAGAPLPAVGGSESVPEAVDAAGAAVVDAGRFCLFLAGQPFPEADMRKLNAGGAILSKALKAVSGATDAAVTVAYRRHGDLGAAAYDLLVPPYGKAPGTATVQLVEVATAFDAMAGARTTAARAATVESLLRRATALEAKYLLKLMLGDMRIGVKQSLIEEGIAVATGAEVVAVRHAVMLEADLQRAVVRAFAGTLAEARMTLFHPLGFMLASPVETPEEAVERFTEKPKKVAVPKPAKVRGQKGKKGEESKVFASAADIEVGALPVNAGEQGFAEDVALEALRIAGRSSGNDSGMDSEAEEGTGGIFGGITVDGVGPVGTAPIHALLEDKFDGIRAQLHCGDPAQPGRVAIYSRSREDITESFPEIAEAFGRVSAEPSGAILDGEILGWDLAGDKALPFAILGQRIGRKRVDDELRRTIPVLFMAFDLMFADGELLLPQPLRERRVRLEQVVAEMLPKTCAPLAAAPATGVMATGVAATKGQKEQQGSLFISANLHSAGSASDGPAQEQTEQGSVQEFGSEMPGLEISGSDFLSSEIPGLQVPDLSGGGVQRLRLSRVEMVESAEGVDRGYREARARANEGVMLKSAGSAYLPGRRGLAWLKLKRQLATLDVVITGAEYGTGRRSQFLSDYTFAVRGPEGDLLNVGKAYSGVTDAEITELTEWLKAHTLEDFGHFRTVEPIRILEVAFNNVMRSDRHASGFALRFPRIIRLRDDKPVEEIDTLARVEEVYHSQPDRPEEG